MIREAVLLSQGDESAPFRVFFMKIGPLPCYHLSSAKVEVRSEKCIGKIFSYHHMKRVQANFSLFIWDSGRADVHTAHGRYILS